jgi:hypothetical protein
VLAYLEALRDALIAREVDAIRRLLAHPLAGALTDAVRAEAQRVLQGLMPPIAVPLATLQLYHQTAHCLGVARDARAVGFLSGAPVLRSRRSTAQIELPLQVA